MFKIDHEEFTVKGLSAKTQMEIEKALVKHPIVRTFEVIDLKRTTNLGLIEKI